MDTMTAVAFLEPGRLGVVERPKPIPRAGEAVIRITTTTICGTDVHIVKGEYAVRPGLVLGHEPVGVIDALGEGVGPEYHVGQRVVVGAITPCGQCFYCLNGSHSQCGGPLGGWRFGNTIDGAWAEYLLVPDARANLAPIPDGLSDEDVLLVPDIFSTGLSGAESAGIMLFLMGDRRRRMDPPQPTLQVGDRREAPPPLARSKPPTCRAIGASPTVARL
jgi:threonine dehydrogenase-like Zn-dependent dehydrogenase